ncbi:MAG: tagaturonate reductase [Maribacter sp.]|nr:tagaturonate reductase [Maribacter sp.]
MKRLNRHHIGLEAKLPIRILQFGGGNFLRAFVDWMVEILNEKTDFNGGVAVIKPTEHGNYQTLKMQDGLFTVILEGIDNGHVVTEKKLVTCVQQVINPYGEWDQFLKLATNADVRFVVSNTTEAGIRFNANDTFDSRPPKEFPAKLTIWLWQRFLHFNGEVDKGCILLPCELIEKNGEALKASIMQYADHWQLTPEFKDWLQNNNHFCNTLVDRIVSGFPKDQEHAIFKDLKYRDELLVAGENYHSWVIQGSEPAQEELPFSDTGLHVEFVNDLGPYRERKVRILNGAHTVMVPLAILYGLETVRESMEDKFMGPFIKHAVCDEIIPVVGMDRVALEVFADSVFDRFRNPFIKHELASIALNSISKFKVRVLPSILKYISLKHKLPVNLIFAFAGLIRFYKGDWKMKELPVKDDPKIIIEMAGIWKSGNYETIANNVLANTSFWGQDLTVYSGLSSALKLALQLIEEQGVEAGFDLFKINVLN